MENLRKRMNVYLENDVTDGIPIEEISVNEYMKDHILNCGERYEFMIGHRSYTHNV